jgi:hypothetical protein
LPENITVDVDHLEYVPSPFKIYKASDLVPTDEDALGTTYYGWRLEVSVDPRELKKNPEVRSTKNNNIIRPAVEPFRFQAWIRNNCIVVKVPLLWWQDRGNDDHLLRTKYESQPWFESYMSGRDEFRKGVIEKYGKDNANYQKAFKHVIFHFTSSERPQRKFELVASDIKMNEGKEPTHLKLHYQSYVVEGEEIEVEVTTKDSATGMEVDMTVPGIEVTSFSLVNFYVADIGIPVKRSGEDTFKANQIVDDELAAAMAADANIRGGRRVKKKATS